MVSAVLATFLGSVLLFSLEPYVGKLLLPEFGGTPLLWNSCMVFFQVALLVGYGVAMLLVRHVPTGGQFAIELGLLALLFALYPNAQGIVELSGAAPGVSLVASLTRHVLPTFVALAALTTLVQSWVAAGNAAGSPYRLYAASNAGSLFGLFAYPLLFEPLLSLRGQRMAFLTLLGLLIATIALLAMLRPRGAIAAPVPASQLSGDSVAQVAPFTPAAWWRVIALTAIPASLLLSVTNYVLTDVASLPLFWVIPLALYLVTFIVAFGGRTRRLPLLERIFTMLVLFVVVALSAEANSPAWVLIPAHLLVFFVASLLCHVRVASMAPDPRHLASFYLAVSIGGAIGGMITLLVPPLVTNAMLEYPVALILATTVLVATDSARTSSRRMLFDLLLPGALVLVGALLFRRAANAELLRWAPVALAPAALLALEANERGMAFTRRLASLWAAALLVPSAYGQTLFAERSFFGRVRVTNDAQRGAHMLVHGATVHGVQRTVAERGCSPTTYYHPTGPAGDFLTALPASPVPRRIALVGLGSGALACYARAGEIWDLFELDPVVARVASDTAYFRFLAHSRAAAQRMILGDARLAIARDSVTRYDVMIIDAFSSDAIPIHLLTREAVALYASRLAPGGALLFHVSNRFFRLRPVLGAVAPTVGLDGWVASDLLLTDADEAVVKYPSEWIVLATPGQRPAPEARWTRLPAESRRVWTDDYSNPISAMKPLGSTTQH
jgi:spermidine synthase